MAPALAPTLGAVLVAAWWVLTAPGTGPGEATSAVPLGVAAVAGLAASAGTVALGRWWQPRFGSATTASLVTLVAAGVWLAVPDTELAVGALGALAGLTAGTAAMPKSDDQPGPAARWAWAAPAALVTWALLWGGRGRPAAALGVSAAWALVVLLPAAVAVRRGGPQASWAVVAGQAVVVAVASRWAARTGDLIVAGLRAAATVALAAVVALALARSGPASHGPDGKRDPG